MDTWGFQQEGNSRISGLARVRTDAAVRHLVKAAGTIVQDFIFFVDVVGDRSPLQGVDKVAWRPWQEDESYEAYLGRILSEAGDGVALGRYQLSVKLASTDARYKRQPTLWRAQGIPAHWQFHDVMHLLEAMGFTEILLDECYRGKNRAAWTFKGLRADDMSVVQRPVAWGEDQTSDITIVKEIARREPRQAIRTLKSERVISFGDVARVAGNKHRAHEGPSAAAPIQHEDAKGKKRTAPPLEPSHMEVGDEWRPSAARIANPGEGNCLYYALAAARIGGKDRSHRQLRLWVVACVRKRSDTFEAQWRSGGAYNGFGRPANMDWETYLKEQEMNATWGGALEASAAAVGAGCRIWLATSENHLYLLNPDGASGFICLWYDAVAQHYELFNRILMRAILERYKVCNIQAREALEQNLLRGGVPSMPNISDFASTASSKRRRQASLPALSDFASHAGSDRQPMSNRRGVAGGVQVSGPIPGGGAAEPKVIVDLNPWQQHSYGGPKKGQKPIKPPWANKVIVRYGHVPTFVAHPGKVLRWKCYCNFHVDAEDSTQLSHRRNLHVRRAHKKVDQQKCPKLSWASTQPEIRKVAEGIHLAWQCARCRQGIPRHEATTSQIRMAAAAHLASCKGAARTIRANGLQLQEERRKKGLPVFFYRTAPKFRKAAVLRMVQNNEAHSHEFVPVTLPRQKFKKGSKTALYGWVCKKCTRLYGGVSAKYIRQPCKGRGVRKDYVKYKVKYWALWRRFYPQSVIEYVTAVESTKGEVEAMEHGAFGNKRRERVPALQQCRWYRNLLEDGDVEAQPGPVSQRSGRLFMDSCLRLYFLNAGGLDNTYGGIVEAMATTEGKPHILGIVEARAKPGQRRSLLDHMEKLGYRAWYFGCGELRNVNGVEYSKGGVLVAVRRDVRGGSSEYFIENAGEAVLMDFETFGVTIGWSRPNEDPGLFEQKVSEWAVQATRQGQVWLSAADWNELPDQNVLVQGGCKIVAPRNSAGWIPTRWSSDRCIDYLLTNDTSGSYQIRVGETKVSDHKSIWLSAHTHVAQEDGFQLVPTPSFVKPTGVDPRRWREVVSKHYSADLIMVTDTEQEWSTLCEKASAAFVNAYREFGIAAPLNGTRPKGSRADVQKIKSGTNKPVRDREHQLATLLGRLYEARRQRLLGHPDVELERRIDGALPPGIPSGAGDPAIAAAENMLLERKQERKVCAIRTWREKLRNNSPYLGRWLRGNFLSLPVAVRDHETGACSRSSTEALRNIIKFWRAVWDRDVMASLQAAREQLRQVEPGPQAHWDISAAQLQAAAKRKTGGSAGPDGWEQAEVSFLPDKHWRDFQTLLERWRARGQFPECWRDSRMVMLPKMAPDQFGAILAAKTRPITVMSIYYRIAMSALTRSQEVRQWLQEVAPEFSHGGICGRSAPNALAALEAYLRSRPRCIMVSLDMKQCFDRVHPVLGVATLLAKGFDESWASLAMWSWGQQHRYIQLGRQVASCPQTVCSSIPQGCPLAPICLVALLADPARNVQEGHNDHELLQSLYLDDRAGVTADPRTAMRFIHRWQALCDQLGLAENMDKMEICCTDPRDESILQDFGVLAERFGNGASVLGASFGHEQAVRDREAKAEAVLARLTLLPASAHFKERVYRQRIVPLSFMGYMVVRV